MSEREPSTDRSAEDDEGLISRFWKAPPATPAPAPPPPAEDSDTEAT